LLQEVTGSLVGIAMKGTPDLFLADATLYLELSGVICIAWQWLLQGLAAQKALQETTSEIDRNFYEGKWFTMRYFFEYELPKIEGLRTRLMNPDGLTVSMQTRHFED
jgi:hypothetical protein